MNCNRGYPLGVKTNDVASLPALNYYFINVVTYVVYIKGTVGSYRYIRKRRTAPFPLLLRCLFLRGPRGCVLSVWDDKAPPGVLERYLGQTVFKNNENI